MMFSTLQSSPCGRQNFLGKHFGYTSLDESGPYCIERALSLHSVPPKQHEHSSKSQMV
jgi:hypothetical protein